jgi:hypothetical protein
MIKSPFGIILAGAAFLFALSPEARKAARRLAVKGTGTLLDITDQIKEAASELPTANNDNEKTSEY